MSLDKFKSRSRDLRAARGLPSGNFFHTARVRIIKGTAASFIMMRQSHFCMIIY